MKFDSRMRRVTMIAGIISLPVIIFFIFSVRSNEKQQRLNSAEIVHQHAVNTAQEISSQLARYVSMLDTFAVALDALPQDTNIRNDFVTRFLSLHGDIVDFAIVNSRGREIIHAAAQNREKNKLADRSQNIEFISLKENNFYIGPFFLSQNNPVLLIGRPIISSETQSIKGGVFALLKADRIIASLGRAGEKKAHAFVVNNKGVMIAHAHQALFNDAKDLSHNPAIAAARAGKTEFTHIYKNTLTEKVVGSAVPLRFVTTDDRELSPGWFLVWETPVTIAFASASSGRNGAIGLVFIIVLFVVLVSFGINHKIDTLFDTITNAIGELNAGNFGHRMQKSDSVLPQSVITSFNAFAHTFENIAHEADKKQHAVEKERSKFTLALSEVSDAVFVCDADGIITFANKPAEYLTGFSDVMINGKHIDEVVRLHAGEKSIAIGAYYAGAEFGHGLVSLDTAEGLRLITGAGEDRPVVARIGLLPHQEPGTHDGYIVMLRDASKEAFLKKIRVDFFATVLHQLRIPLTEIKWALSLLAGKEFGALSLKQKKILRKSWKSSEYAIMLADNLSKIAMLETNEFFSKKLRVDIKQIIADCIDMRSVEARKKGIAIRYQKPRGALRVCVDPSAIKIAIGNILDNALAYTYKGGEVVISLEKTDADIRIDIQDTGIGIAKEDQEFIFNKFFRGANAVTMVSDGMGLGLFIAQAIIRGHGGRIDIESELDKGSHVIIHIPAEGVII